MKFAWFTPFAVNSAIGKVGCAICEELAKHHEVDIWTPYFDEYISTSINVIKFESRTFPLHALEAYDFVLYNMGNFSGFHREIYEVSKQFPGVIIQHDRTMFHFFNQMHVIPEYGGNPETGLPEFQKLLITYHGDIGKQAASSIYAENGVYFNDPEKAIWGGMQFPLLQPITENALGVFTHCGGFTKELKEVYNGPTDYSYLPVNVQKNSCKSAIQVKKNNRLLLVSTGIVHVIKNIHVVTDVLLQNPDICEKVCYAVIGNYVSEYGLHLEELANTRLKDTLFMLDYQPDDVMESYLKEADICINLRYPNSEVCSLSLLEQMAHGNPVIVFNSGVYGEMPDDAVVKISRKDEQTELANALRKLISSEKKRENIGKNASKFIKEYCTAESYSKKLITFLEGINTFYDIADKVFDRINHINKYYGFNEKNVPVTLNRFVYESDLLFNKQMNTRTTNVLGVWVGFPYIVHNLSREGIIKFLTNMVDALMAGFNIDCEIWCYSLNEEDIRISFSSVLNKYSNRVLLITEKNWIDVFELDQNMKNINYEVNESYDNLAILARDYSRADCFVPAIMYLDNVLLTEKPIFVPAHDMNASKYYNDFVTADPMHKSHFVEIQYRAENLARSGAYMFSASQEIRNGQILKYLYNIRKEDTGVVYLPTIIPPKIESRTHSKNEIMKKFGIKGRYLFYPTQVRPYKNIQLLVKVLSHIDSDVKLVLTGEPDDVEKVAAAIKENDLQSRVIKVGSLSEVELYSLYKYAAAVPVTSLVEAGFPLQALEALYMDAPLVLSNISQVRERMEHVGLSIKNPGFELFTPDDLEACIAAVKRVLKNPDAAIKKQRAVKSKLLNYTWADAAKLYHKIFFSKQEVRNER